MKKILFILVIVVFWLPILQEQFKLFTLQDLAGVTAPQVEPVFNKHNWFDGIFQQQFDDYRGARYGFRSFLIRISNQIDYSLYRYSHSGVVIGKEDYLYETNYLREIAGIDSFGYERMNSMMQEVYETQNYLKDRNILLVTLLAPGKPYYYKEFIPSYYAKRLSAQTDYHYVSSIAKKMDLNLIDANDWFVKAKDTTRYPLFPKQGIHWNHYGMAVVADSLIKYIEAKKHIDLPEYSYAIKFPEKLQGTDNDLGDVLNLLVEPKNPIMPYPEFYFFPNEKVRPRLLVVGDSFYWTLLGSGIITNLFHDPRYHYYNSSIYDSTGEHVEKGVDLNLLSELNKYDIVLFIQSTPNDHDIGCGFNRQLKNNIKQHDELTKNYLDKIKNENAYPDLINNFSRLNNVSTDSSMKFISDSLAMAYMNRVVEIKTGMRKVPAWLAQIEEKAKGWNVSLEDAMEKDAEWMINQEAGNALKK